MAVSSTRERRPTAIWPYLVMPIIVLVAFYVLYRMHQRPGSEALPPQPAAATQDMPA